MHSSPIKAWSYTQKKAIYNNYISVYYWEFDYAATITYNQMGDITGTKDIAIFNAGCGNVNPITSGCTIKPHQSSVSHTKLPLPIR